MNSIPVIPLLIVVFFVGFGIAWKWSGSRARKESKVELSKAKRELKLSDDSLTVCQNAAKSSTAEINRLKEALEVEKKSGGRAATDAQSQKTRVYELGEEIKKLEAENGNLQTAKSQAAVYRQKLDDHINRMIEDVPISELKGIGDATVPKLEGEDINTIQDIAQLTDGHVEQLFEDKVLPKTARKYDFRAEAKAMVEELSN